MAEIHHSQNTFVILPFITVFLHLPRLTSGVHSPQNIELEVVNGTDFLILSWDYQAGANYSKIGIGWYIGKSAHAEVGTGPTLAPCNNSSSRCSYCVSNRRHHTSCHQFDPIYRDSLTAWMDYEGIVTYRVAACRTNESNSCAYSMRRDYKIPPGAPSAVENVHARPLSSKSVEITWIAPNQTRGTIISYMVYYKASDGQMKYHTYLIHQFNGTKVTLDGLKPMTTYTISMVASTSRENGEESDTTSVTTYENECVSSPCQNNGQCKVTADTFDCDCAEKWEGKSCDIPKGYTLDNRMCLNDDDFISVENNSTLAFCTEKCNSDSSCKSFEYGRGYDSSEEFKSDLNTKGVGQCKLRSGNKNSYKLKSCVYDHYEKSSVKGSVGTIVPYLSLLSLSVILAAVSNR